MEAAVRAKVQETAQGNSSELQRGIIGEVAKQLRKNRTKTKTPAYARVLGNKKVSGQLTLLL
ncbi:hypothetical protein L2725_03540 [Shewanella corallii]|uniref:Uncharacterized protein n=1 Tax=Shewanella corallii TaxID=560080 RepID=A0ABT0N345_9GAMM|nr:hypothetical protein [Shewanella corallii]MCL2912867.1 hypothetical protein [Shewanella corallii]